MTESHSLPSRRDLIASAFATTAVLTVPEITAADDAPALIARQTAPDNLEFPFSRLDEFLTPNELFYVRSHFPTPKLTKEDYRLAVIGKVDTPLSLTLDALKSLPTATIPMTLECAGNGRVFLTPPATGVQWETGAVSTAEWMGARLSDVLAQAGIQKDAVEIVLEGADKGEIRNPPRPGVPIPFARSLPIRKEFLRDVILAYKMNGEELSPAHGYPIRAAVPGHYGMASVKWLSRLIVTDKPFMGYYQTIDYAYWEMASGTPERKPLREMQPKALLARPANRARVKAGNVIRLFGAAWTGGDAQISRVELSLNSGKIIADATLLGKSVPYAWRLFEYRWKVPAAPGTYVLAARAFDTAGNAQPLVRDPNRENYMINHVIPIEIIAG
jgi:DMSO/TMAO reductase YedYZ molybdopterin-dependent catalytic subunit